MQLGCKFLFGISAIGTCLAHPGLELFERAGTVCNADNCLRGFRAVSPATRTAEASSYCSSYLSTSIPPVTVTASVTTTSTTTPVVTTITAFPSTVTSVVYNVFTTTITGVPDILTKRTATPATTTFPSYASLCTAQGTTSQAVRVKSACSCLIISSPATTTSTATSTVVTTASTPITTFFPTVTQTVTSFTSTSTSYVAPSCATPTPGYPVSPIPSGKSCGTVFGDDTGANLYLQNDSLTREQCIQACQTGSFALPCKAIGVPSNGQPGCKVLYNAVRDAGIDGLGTYYQFYDVDCFVCPAS